MKADLKLMISTHEKLARGESVDKDAVSVLLLGGIINILRQHHTILDIEVRVKSIDVENKNRIESLEDWAFKQGFDRFIN